MISYHLQRSFSLLRLTKFTFFKIIWSINPNPPGSSKSTYQNPLKFWHARSWEEQFYPTKDIYERDFDFNYSKTLLLYFTATTFLPFYLHKFKEQCNFSHLIMFQFRDHSKSMSYELPSGLCLVFPIKHLLAVGAIQ